MSIEAVPLGPRGVTTRGGTRLVHETDAAGGSISWNGASDRTATPPVPIPAKDSTIWNYSWSSFFVGGSRVDDNLKVKLDSSENLYLVGLTDSPEFPTTPGAYDSTLVHYDVCVGKIDPQTKTLIGSTFIGGDTGLENPLDVVVDDLDNLIICGSTGSSDFPTTPSAYDIKANGFDGFALKLSAAGNQLIWSTYLGGSYSDLIYCLYLEEDNSVFLGGWTSSDDFPTTPGAFDNTHDIGDSGVDAVLLHLDGTGSSHEARWDGRDRHGREMPSGGYIARLVTEQGASSRKMVLAR